MACFSTDDPPVADPKSNALDTLNIQEEAARLVYDLEDEYQGRAAKNKLGFVNTLLMGTEATGPTTEALKFGDAGFQSELFKQRPDIKQWWDRTRAAEGNTRTFDEWFTDVVQIGQELEKDGSYDHVRSWGGWGPTGGEKRTKYRAVEGEYNAHMDMADLALNGIAVVTPGTAAQKGYLNILDDVQAKVQDYRRKGMEADIAAVEDLAPRARDAYRSAYPELNKLLDTLTDQSIQDVQNSGMSDLQRQRNADQVRSQYARMGRDFSNREAQDIFTMNAQAEDALKTSAYNRAFGVTDRQAKYGMDPFSAILGRSGRVADAQGLAGGAMANYQNQFDPFSPATHSQWAANNQNIINADIARVNANASLLGAGLGAFGNLGGGFLSSLPWGSPANPKPKGP
tara:strand:- start:4689 stop:5885 length:1197 start_codon:yes stop_codon:yes gene_type:complete